MHRRHKQGPIPSEERAIVELDVDGTMVDGGRDSLPVGGLVIAFVAIAAVAGLVFGYILGEGQRGEPDRVMATLLVGRRIPPPDTYSPCRLKEPAVRQHLSSSALTSTVSGSLSRGWIWSSDCAHPPPPR